jgi:MoCo/4Fe-4S cofactor protein with predicted Tat translocation signal
MNSLPIPPELEINRGGPRFWKSLEEWSHSPEFLPYLHREFPEYASEWDNGISRRRFLQLMGASLALAGLTACSRQPQQKLVPYVSRPEEVIPGKSLFYATTFPHHGYGKGVLVRTEMARPTKIEGNPDHPASLGATDVFMQASILCLYDPDRSQTIRQGTDISNWDAVMQFAGKRVEEHEKDQGAGFFLLTGRTTSPTFADQLQRLQKRFPKLNWCEYDSTQPVRARSVSGKNAEPHYDLSKADVIVSLDADFLLEGPANLMMTKAFSKKRRDPNSNFSRLYVVESVPSITGVKADVRRRRKPSEIVAFAQELADGIVGGVAPADPDVRQLVAELQQHRGTSVIIAGDYQPEIVHVLAFNLNQALGNIGVTVNYGEAPNPPITALALTDFIAALQSGAATTLLMAGVNPVYDLPPALHFAEALNRATHSVHLGLYDDETGSRCHWHLPETHFLEQWGDLLAVDGTPSLIQPMIEALYPSSTSLLEVLSLFVDLPPQKGYDIVRDFWQSKLDPIAPNAWENSLNKGVMVGLAPNAISAPINVTALAAAPSPAPVSSQMELVFRPDPSVDDGRYANNAWLQELPKPLSKLTWDNVAMMSGVTAEMLGVETGDVIRLETKDGSVDAPVWIQPGHADECVSVTLGYGRSQPGQVARGVGFAAGALRSSLQDWSREIVRVQPTGARHELASTQVHFSMEGRGLIQVETLAAYKIDPRKAQEEKPNPPAEDNLYTPYEYKNYAWAMSIDLNSCVGCNACVIACQAENNIPVVGKDQVIKGREMHWIRVDRYFEGEPVGATVHSSEGLNDMVYNRCVGTRYCSNNCPYKVRRFNFLEYDDVRHPTLALQKNPNVTVRSRGVMEKCTYCVQRIESARIDAQEQMRPIRDGEIITACQAACPADAIVFGDINDPASRVSRLKALPRDYGLLADLNTHPRTTYLSKVTNPPPAT